jgi:predicted nucleotidyltransferase component of viral defense system
MQILTPLQVDFIRSFARHKYGSFFFLTGGTALSAFYLFHRYSDDLDFFTENEGAIAPLVPMLRDIALQTESQIEITREFTTFLELFMSRKDETIKLHFALDAPYRLQKILKNAEYEIFIDNQLDIACNKLSALFDRFADKDFVDVFFLSREFIPFEEIFDNAKKKHVGMDEYWLAASLKNIDKVETLPRMIKPVTTGEMRDFYYDKIKYLMSRIHPA